MSQLEFVDYAIGNWECKCGNLKGLHHLRSTCKNPACGATIQTELAGSFDAGAKTASGSGEYESAAIGDGTFSLTRLVAFQFYGCGYFEDFNLGDPTLCGGRVMFAVHFTPDVGAPFDGTIEINCQIHGASNQPPPGTSEGIKINTRGVNFNKHVTGDNVFIQT